MGPSKPGFRVPDLSLSRKAAAQQEEEVSFCKQFLAKTRDMCVQRIKFYDSTDILRPRDMSKYFWKLYLVERLICHNSGRKNKPNPAKSHKNLDLIS